MLSRSSAIALSVLLSCAAGVARADTSNITVTVFVAQCTDGLDNDGDSLIDYPSDAGCSSTGDDDEVDPILAVCEDTVDDDGDGLTDYPADPGCDSLSDASEVNLSGGGGGGGGGGWTNSLGGSASSSPRASVIFAGYSAPRSIVRSFANGRLLGESLVGDDGRYSISISDIAAGFHVFGLMSIDPSGRFSALQNVPMRLSADSRTTVDGVVLAPSISLEEGTTIRISGSTIPYAQVTLSVSARSFDTRSDLLGRYFFELERGTFAAGVHSARVHAEAGSFVAPFGLPVQFTIGERVVLSPQRADLNGDTRVDITDFSVLLYWFRRDLSPALLELERERLSGDGRIDFTDFSIMAYHWTT